MWARYAVGAGPPDGAGSNRVSDAEREAKLAAMAEEAAKHHRWFAVEANNTAWELMDKPDRTPDDEDVLIARVHASWYHWAHAGDAKNLAIADWMCSHAYALMGRLEPAKFHAQRCLDRCTRHGVGDFPLGYAHEALARVALMEGDRAAVERHYAEALAIGATVAEADDKEILDADLAAFATLAALD